MEKCSAVYKGLEILVDVEGGSFSSSNIESEKNSLGVKEFKRVDLDDPKDDKSGGVDAKGCRVSGCCCNCGGGWIC